MKPVLLTLGLFTAAMATPAKADPFEAVNRFAIDVTAGQDISSAYGIDDISSDEKERLSSLAGCSPKVGAGSSKALVYLHFVCESAEHSPTMREVTLSSQNGDWKLLGVSELRAMGPTDAAQGASELPSPSEQVKKFVRSVRTKEDASLGGLIPLIDGQTAALARLSECKWSVLGRQRRNVQSILLDCPADVSAVTLIQISFDEEGRATMVGVEAAEIIKRPAL